MGEHFHHECGFRKVKVTYFLTKARKSKGSVYQKILNLLAQYLPSTYCALDTVLAAGNAATQLECLLPGDGEEKAQECRQSHRPGES